VNRWIKLGDPQKVERSKTDEKPMDKVIVLFIVPWCDESYVSEICLCEILRLSQQFGMLLCIDW